MMQMQPRPPYTLALSDLHKSFGCAQIIRGVNLAIEAGERVAIIGPNGAGKSTLLDLISGRCSPSSGQVFLHGKRIDGKKPFEINRLGLARSFQVSNIFPQLSVFENLRCGVLWSMGYGYSCWRLLSGLYAVNARVQLLLDKIGLQEKRETLAAELTYAQQRALELGITVAGDARVILLDEPTAGMSRSETEHFTALIRELTQGRTLLMVEHDMQVVFDLADKIAVLVYGEVIAFESPEKVRANARVQQAYLGGGDDLPGGTGLC